MDRVRRRRMVDTLDKKTLNKIEKLCKKYNVESDLIDFHSIWDRNLTDGENLNIIEGMIKEMSNNSLNLITKNEINTIKEKEENRKLEEFKEEELKAKKELDKAIETIIKTQTTKPISHSIQH
jgi:hypothetical protein